MQKSGTPFDTLLGTLDALNLKIETVKFPFFFQVIFRNPPNSLVYTLYVYLWSSIVSMCLFLWKARYKVRSYCPRAHRKRVHFMIAIISRALKLRWSWRVKFHFHWMRTNKLDREINYLMKPCFEGLPITKLSIAVYETYSVNAFATSESSSMISRHCIWRRKKMNK